MAAAFACYGAGYILAAGAPPKPAGDWFSLMGGILFATAAVLTIPAAAIVLPTGTLPGPRWR